MEKAKKTTRRQNKQTLPSLDNTKSNSQLLVKNIQIGQSFEDRSGILGSKEKLKDLRKLFFQYKSNASILTTSPYFTNRAQQKKVVAYIKTHRY
jgi:hypothetical protein